MLCSSLATSSSQESLAPSHESRKAGPASYLLQHLGEQALQLTSAEPALPLVCCAVASVKKRSPPFLFALTTMSWLAGELTQVGVKREGELPLPISCCSTGEPASSVSVGALALPLVCVCCVAAWEKERCS